MPTPTSSYSDALQAVKPQLLPTAKQGASVFREALFFILKMAPDGV
jgi:hypothetical protein